MGAYAARFSYKGETRVLIVVIGGAWGHYCLGEVQAKMPMI